MRRKEDLRLLTGAGRFTDDFNLKAQAYAAMVRSPYPHAKILRIDSGPARAMAGVLGVYSGADCVGDGLRPIPHNPLPTTRAATRSMPEAAAPCATKKTSQRCSGSIPENCA